MPKVIGWDEVKLRQYRRPTTLHTVRTPFLNSEIDQKRPESPAFNVDFPVAVLSQGDPGRVTDPHYHFEDEFLLIAEGSGVLGRNRIYPYTVFFARAYTPYGPIIGDSKTGVSFFVLSARFEAGAQWLPEKMQELKQIPDRRPWQIARQASFADQLPSTPFELKEIPDIQDDQGLFACTLELAPDAVAMAPNPAKGDGQFLVVVKGSIWHENKEHMAYTVVFIKPNEPAFVTRAGKQGAQVIVMNFPEVTARMPQRTTVSDATATGTATWQCELCSFCYDEALGLPGDGIAPGTKWSDIPANWTCPDCSASKEDFKRKE